MAELTTKQYLDLTGLQSYDAKAKARTEAAIKVVDDKVVENTGKIAENKANIASNAVKITANETAIGEAAQAAATAQAEVDALESIVSGMYTNEQIDEAIEAAKTASTYDDTEVKASINANAEAIAAINNEETGILKQSKDYTDTTVAQAVEDVKASLASALTYKGQKATVSELPAEGNKCGDVWSVAEKSAEYVWIVDNVETDEGHWEELGTAVDLSGYATKEQVTADIATAKSEAIAAAATDAALKASAKAEEAFTRAKDYADSLADNYEVAGAAATAEANAKSYTDTEVQSVYNAMGSIPESEIASLFA